MLKYVSGILGLFVGLEAGIGLCPTPACDASEAGAVDTVYEVWPRTGQEKPSGDQLPTYGVSFPTQFFAQHNADCGKDMVKAATVQAARLPEIRTAETLKSGSGIHSEREDAWAIAELSLESIRQTGDLASAVQAVARLANRCNSEINECNPAEPVVQLIASGHPGSAERLLSPVSFQEGELPNQQGEVSENSSRVLDISTVVPASQGSDFIMLKCLNEVRLDLATVSEKDLPGSAKNEAREHMSRAGTQQNWPTATWVSFRPQRNLFPFQHNPLYFEDPNLERCGQTTGCLTELTSIFHFAGRIPALPYLMTVEPPCTLVCAKPDCPTCHSFGCDAYVPHADEVDPGGVAVQAAMTVGFLFLIP